MTPEAILLSMPPTSPPPPPTIPPEILNQLPGVNVQMNSGQEHLIAIRSPVLTGGAGQGSFLILENGVPTRSPAFGNVNSLIEPHHEVADAIEVVRGPGSAKYGSNAVHGLINVILPEPGEGSEVPRLLWHAGPLAHGHEAGRGPALAVQSLAT
jgi:outer membrane cobalamin receptor